MRKTVLPVVVLLLSLVVFRPSLGRTAPQAPVLSVPTSAQATGLCPSLDPPSGNTVSVDNKDDLISAVNAASVGDTILVANGTYEFVYGEYMRVEADGVTIRSASGNRDAVIIDGNYSATELVQIVASNVTVADLTLREAQYHPIHVMTGGSVDTVNTLIYNVHIVDPGQQAIKINPADAGYYVDDGTIACSHIELTDAGRPQVWTINGSCYTGGVDAHQAQGWTIRDNRIEGFWCPGNGLDGCEGGDLSEHGIHMWRGCRDTVIERNVLIDNARGIGLGLVDSGTARTYPDDPCPGVSGYIDDYLGMVRNNTISANRSLLFNSDCGFDCGICLASACGAQAVHNTVYTADPAHTFSSIEWRFSTTSAEITNNLVNHIMRERDGASGTQGGNVTNATSGWFVDAGAGDLHLVSAAMDAIDQGVGVASGTCDGDIDGDSRPIGSARDVGADEYGIPAPAAVTDLHISSAVTSTTSLTVTLVWTPPSGALTTTLRYDGMPIALSNWGTAMLLTDTLTGTASVYTAVLSYEGGTVYFGHRSQNEGGMSGLSNLAFWPHHDVFLPVVMRGYAP